MYKYVHTVSGMVPNTRNPGMNSDCICDQVAVPDTTNSATEPVISDPKPSTAKPLRPKPADPKPYTLYPKP